MPVDIPTAQWPVDARLARALLREQHPDLAGLPLRRLGSGWDTVVFRLGTELTVRIPRRELGAELVLIEQRWLPQLARRLPLPVPEPVRVGAPGPTLGLPWSVCRYVPGRPVAADGLPAGKPAGARGAAPEQLADFLRALHVPAPADAPTNPARDVPLAARDTSVRAALTQVPAEHRGRLAEVWEECVAAPGYGGSPVWLHGDLHGLNVLRVRARITGVIDFGDICAGDPACDLASAWLLLDGPGRRRFRSGYPADEDLWTRGRGWATFLAVMFLAHSASDERNAAMGVRALGQVTGPGQGTTD